MLKSTQDKDSLNLLQHPLKVNINKPVSCIAFAVTSQHVTCSSKVKSIRKHKTSRRVAAQTLTSITQTYWASDWQKNLTLCIYVPSHSLRCLWLKANSEQFQHLYWHCYYKKHYCFPSLACCCQVKPFKCLCRII